MLRFNPHIIIFMTSLKTARNTIIPYSIIIFILMLAYAILGTMVFGNTMYEFSGMKESIFTVLLMSLGAQMKFPNLIEDFKVEGPIYGFSYKLLMSFIFVNFFVAILNDSYEDVKASTDKNSKEFEMAEFILDRLK
ncbi:predicted protein, partial [Nematostella vectensis]